MGVGNDFDIIDGTEELSTETIDGDEIFFDFLTSNCSRKCFSDQLKGIFPTWMRNGPSSIIRTCRFKVELFFIIVSLNTIELIGME